MTFAQPPVPDPWALHAAWGQASCVPTSLLGSNFLQQLAWFIHLSLKRLFFIFCESAAHTADTGRKADVAEGALLLSRFGNPSPLGVVVALLTLSLLGSKVVAGGAIGASAKNLGPSGWFLVMRFGDQAA